MNPFKIILATLVIFASGVLTGGFLVYRTQNKVTTSSVSTEISAGIPAPWLLQRVDFLRRIRGELDLTPEQEKKIQDIIRRSQDRLRPLWEQISPQLRDELSLVRQQISVELTPDQRVRFQKILRTRSPRRMGDPPSMEGRRQRKFLFPDGLSKSPPMGTNALNNSFAPGSGTP